MTTLWWTTYWWWWLLAVFVTWVVPELATLAIRHHLGLARIQDWTLSDTIRRWSVKYRWLAPLIAGTCAFLLWHFFIETNA